MMTLRPMIMNDATDLLAIKNYPETRRFAIASHEEIGLMDHYKWIKENIQYFQTITENDNMLGFLRIQNDELSIWILRSFWGKGIATMAIENVAYKGMTAKVVDGNIGSFKAFLRAGFEPVKHVKNYYILQKI